MVTKKIGIAVVNFRTPMLVKNLVDSIRELNVKNTNTCMVVVDNHSGDDSAQFLSNFIEENGLSEWVELVCAMRNGGFSYGNNLAIRTLLQKGCDYVWLLNPDTRVLPGAQAALIECLESSPDIGIAGSFLQDADGTGQIASFNFPTPTGEFINSSGLGLLRKAFPRRVVAEEIPEHRKVVDWVAGASMMIKSEVFTEIGLMDEEYFLYYEEVDFCMQARAAGLFTVFEPQSKVIHLVGAATGISDTRKVAPRRPTYWFDSRRRFFQKNYGFMAAIWSEIMLVLGVCISRLKKVVKREKDLGPPRFLRDFIRNSSCFKGKAITAQSNVREENSGTPANLQRFFALVKEDWIANGRDWTRPGFRALVVYRFGNWRMTIKSRLLRAPFSILYSIMFQRARNVYGIEFPFSIKAGRRIVIEHQGGIVVHGNAVLGDDCVIRQGVTIGNKSMSEPFDAPVIGKRVNIGAGAKLLGKLTVGDDATIGANAVVLINVPNGALAAGVPATIIKKNTERFSKVSYGN